MPHTEDEAHDELGRRELAARTLPGPGLLGREVPHGRPAPLYIGDNLHIPESLFDPQGQSTAALIRPGGRNLALEAVDIASRPFEAAAEAFGPGVTQAPPFNLIRPLAQLPGIGLRTVFGGEPGAILDIDPTPIQESAETRRIMIDLLRGRGDLSILEAGVALSEEFRSRTGAEQFALGVIADPFNVPALKMLELIRLGRFVRVPANVRRAIAKLIPGGAAERPTVAQTVDILAHADAERAVKEAQIIEKRLGLVVAGKDAPPPRPPGEPLGDALPPPRRPDISLSDDLQLPSWEQPRFGIMRKWEGARNVAGVEMQRFFNQGNQNLRRAGFNPNRLTEEDMRSLFEALHGERSIDTLPQNLRSLYDDLNQARRVEERDMLEFLSAVQASGAKTLMAFDARNFASRMLPHPDYFPRGWNIPDIVPKKLVGPRDRLGVTPGFAKPRIDAPFTELLEWAKSRGGGPKSWNPYAMMAERVIAGVEYRESVKIANRARELRIALPVSEAPKTGWRVPRVGPVFEGRPYPNAEGGVSFTQAIATTNPLADFLEVAYGRKPNLPGLAAIQQFTNILKSTKLILSPFQHADFAFRTVGAAFTPTALLRGGPAKFPSFMFDMLTTTLAPRMRERLINNIMDEPALFRDGSFVVPGRMLVEEGWNIGGDLSFIQREFGSFINETTRTLAATFPGRVSQVGIKALKEANDWFQKGLFDGTYRSAQRWSLKHFILPQVRRSHPDWTPRQVAAEAADQVNVMFSTIGIWQDILKNPAYRFLTHNLAFSANETQSLLRGTALALSRPGAPKAGLFREWYIGLYLGMAVIANVVNFWATGKFLPKESYIPINIDDPYAPWTVGYNNRLLSPQIPYVKGRGGVPVYADLVGQMDTAFRWALDPIGALAARTNVLPRFFINQFKSMNFYGETLHGESFGDTVRKRAVQGAIDIGAPIGGTSVLGALREKYPAIYDLVPSSEGRLGFTGLLVQAAGINLRGETTPDYLDRLARAAGNSGFLAPDGQKVRKWDQLLPRQKNRITALPEIEAELLRRDQEGIDRQSEGAIARGSLRKIDDDRLSQEAALDERLRLGLLLEAEGLTPRKYREEFSRIQLVSVAKKAQSNEDFQRFIEEAELPDDPYKRALVEYYLTWDYARRDDGSIDFRRQEMLQAALEQTWTPEQIQVVADNTRLLKHSPTGTKLVHDRKLLEPYFDIIDNIIDGYGVRDAFKVYQLLRTRAERSRFLSVHRPLARALSDARRAERAFERNHRELAQLLVDWDYRDYTFNREVRRAVQERVRNAGR
jgi:hypothetical protein